MALKPFYVNASFSGRSTLLSGGPKVSNRAHMDLSITQNNKGNIVEILNVKSQKNLTRLTTTITIKIPGEEEKVFTIQTED